MFDKAPENLVSWQQVNGSQILMVVVATFLLCAPNGRAEPLDSYCISQVGQKKELNSAPPKDKPARVSVSVNGKPFQVVASGVDRLLLMGGNNTKPIAQVRAPQSEYGNIEDLVLGKNGWLWIDGGETDYMARLDLDSTPPTITQPVKISKLKSHPCSFLGLFFGCEPAQGTYSPTLDRVFVTGHRPTFLGRSHLVTVEMSAGKAKLLPEEAQGARFIADVPKLNGVLLRGASGEALLYDGISITTLLAGSQKQGESSGLPRWRMESLVADERTFLTNVGYLESPPFLMELKAGPTLMPISIPEELGKTWLSLFTLPNQPRLWGVTRHSLVAEVEGGLRTVVAVPAPSFIDGPANIWQASDGAIAFGVRNPITGSSTNYFLMPASPPHRCQVTLNADKPISLSNE